MVQIKDNLISFIARVKSNEKSMEKLSYGVGYDLKASGG